VDLDYSPLVSRGVVRVRGHAMTERRLIMLNPPGRACSPRPECVGRQSIDFSVPKKKLLALSRMLVGDNSRPRGSDPSWPQLAPRVMAIFVGSSKAADVRHSVASIVSGSRIASVVAILIAVRSLVAQARRAL
jgi:hypothetical protein